MSWWFEDAVPGGVVAHPGGRVFADTDQLWLAWTTNNMGDLHGNYDAASRDLYGGVVVLGALTVSVIIGLAQPGEASADNLRWLPPVWRRIRLTFPVRVGDKIRAVSTFEAVGDADSTGGMVSRVIRGLNQDGTVVAEIEEVVRVPRRPPDWVGQRIVDRDVVAS